MHVLVVGGSGFIGSHLCPELVNRGNDVTALSRSPDPDGLPDGVETATGDVTNATSLESAFEGVDVVVNLVALSPLFKPDGGEEMHDRVHRQGTENCVTAAEAADVSRFVQLSALGADAEGQTAYLRAKGEAEEVVRASELDWTILRPSVVFGAGGEFVRFTKLLAPPYVTPLPGGGTTRFQPIWVGDLVPMIADAVEEDDHAGETYDIGGPEVLSLADIARIAHEADGRTSTVVPVPMAVAKLGLSLADPLPFLPMGMDQYRSLRIDNTTDENDASAFGVDPAALRTLADYLEP